jgi:polyphosphate kinase
MNALVRFPTRIDRFVKLPDAGAAGPLRFVLLEQIILAFIGSCFPATVTGHGSFRVIRDSDIEVEEEAEDLVLMFEIALKRRRRGSVIRLEIDASMPERFARISSPATSTSSPPASCDRRPARTRRSQPDHRRRARPS